MRMSPPVVGLVLLLGIALLAGVYFVVSKAPEARVPVTEVPKLSLQTPTKSELRFSDYKGKLVLVNFWAPWCRPCRREIPTLIEFDKRHPDTVVLGLALDYITKDNVSAAIKELGINYPVAFATQEVASRFGGVKGLPTTYFISPEGEIVSRHTGLLTTKRLQSARAKILAESE